MCGRFTLVTAPEELAAFFEMDAPQALHPSYNIAPSAVIPIVRARPVPGDTQKTGQSPHRREMAPAHWGLVPFWAKDPSIGSRMINARCETLAAKPAYRAAFRHRRCLVPASGFYEWKRVGSSKQPFYFQMEGGGPFAFAGLWECWEGADGSALETCAIITTDANRLLAPIHDRMPVIVPPADFARWLDPAANSKEDLAALNALFTPSDGPPMTGWPVSPRVNKPGHDSPDCIEPVRVDPPESGPSQDTFL